MPSSNNELIKKIRDVIEKGGNIDANTRDVLLFSAIVDLYEQIESGREETQTAMQKISNDAQKAITEARAETRKVIDETRPAIIFYRVGVWMASLIGAAILSFIGALITGNAEIIFK